MENLHLFFATRNDLLINIKELESAIDVYYVPVGQFDKKVKEYYSSLMDIEGLGSATATELSLCDSYLVLPKNVKVKSQWVFFGKGGFQHAYDQGKNPKSIVITPGGLCQNQILLAGKVDTIGETNESVELFQKFSGLLTKGFTKVKSYHVGPEALEMLKAGKRLVTIGIKSPKEYDLSLGDPGEKP